MIEPYNAVGLSPTMWGIAKRVGIVRDIEHHASTVSHACRGRHTDAGQVEIPGLLSDFGIRRWPLTVYPADGWYASLTIPDAYVVAEIRRSRSGSSPAWNGLTPSPQM